MLDVDFHRVVDYFARTGSWSHLWTALHNLAELLRGLSDPDAAFLGAATDHADNAPGPAPSHPPAPDRGAVLDVALRAIERHSPHPGRRVRAVWWGGACRTR